MLQKLLIAIGNLLIVFVLSAQGNSIKTVPAEIDFSKKIQIWDGFGFNYHAG